MPRLRFRVLNLGRVCAGPTAVCQLADWGADVIKIEIPVGKQADDDYTGTRYSPARY